MDLKRIGVSFCVDTASEAVRFYGPTELRNTDHGLQYISGALVAAVTASGSEARYGMKRGLIRQYFHSAILALTKGRTRLSKVYLTRSGSKTLDSYDH